MNGFLHDNDGNASSKRLVTLLTLGLICLGYTANLFWDQNVEQFMFDALMYITIAGLGVSGAEKFAKK